jgi:hypothetical protein
MVLVLPSIRPLSGCLAVWQSRYQVTFCAVDHWPARCDLACDSSLHPHIMCHTSKGIANCVQWDFDFTGGGGSH